MESDSINLRTSATNVCATPAASAIARLDRAASRRSSASTRSRLIAFAAGSWFRISRIFSAAGSDKSSVFFLCQRSSSKIASIPRVVTSLCCNMFDGVRAGQDFGRRLLSDFPTATFQRVSTSSASIASRYARATSLTMRTRSKSST